MFKIGDEKTLTLSTGKTITLQIAEFNSKHAIPREYGEENTPSITFVCKDSVFSYFMSGGGGSFTESPIYAQIMEVLYSFPQGLEDLILASDYGGDLLWLLQKEFVTSGNPDKLPLFDNTANLAKGYKWWLYPKELYYKDVYIVDENGQVVYEPDMSKDYGVVLGFYI